MRRDWQDVHEAQYAAAVEATHGNMVNARGQAAGVTSEAVYLGNATYVAAYGSPELIEHLRHHPRTTLAVFEAQWYDVPEELTA